MKRLASFFVLLAVTFVATAAYANPPVRDGRDGGNRHHGGGSAWSFNFGISSGGYAPVYEPRPVYAPRHVYQPTHYRPTTLYRRPCDYGYYPYYRPTTLYRTPWDYPPRYVQPVIVEPAPLIIAPPPPPVVESGPSWNVEIGVFRGR